MAMRLKSIRPAGITVQGDQAFEQIISNGPSGIPVHVYQALEQTISNSELPSVQSALEHLNHLVICLGQYLQVVCPPDFLMSEAQHFWEDALFVKQKLCGNKLGAVVECVADGTDTRFGTTPTALEFAEQPLGPKQLALEFAKQSQCHVGEDKRPLYKRLQALDLEARSKVGGTLDDGYSVPDNSIANTASGLAAAALLAQYKLRTMMNSKVIGKAVQSGKTFAVVEDGEEGGKVLSKLRSWPELRNDAAHIKQWVARTQDLWKKCGNFGVSCMDKCMDSCKAVEWCQADYGESFGSREEFFEHGRNNIRMWSDYATKLEGLPEKAIGTEAAEAAEIAEGAEAAEVVEGAEVAVSVSEAGAATETAVAAVGCASTMVCGVAVLAVLGTGAAVYEIASLIDGMDFSEYREDASTETDFDYQITRMSGEEVMVVRDFSKTNGWIRAASCSSAADSMKQLPLMLQMKSADIREHADAWNHDLTAAAQDGFKLKSVDDENDANYNACWIFCTWHPRIVPTNFNTLMASIQNEFENWYIKVRQFQICSGNVFDCGYNEMINHYTQILKAFYSFDVVWKAFITSLCNPSLNHHWTFCPDSHAAQATIVFAELSDAAAIV